MVHALNQTYKDTQLPLLRDMLVVLEELPITALLRLRLALPHLPVAELPALLKTMAQKDQKSQQQIAA